MLSRMKEAINNLKRKDEGSFSQTLLISMMIPGLVAVILSTALASLFIQYQDNRNTLMESAAETAGARLLGDINTLLPSAFVDLSPTELAEKTTRYDEAQSADTYVSSFTVDAEGWIEATIVVDLQDRAGDPTSWDLKFRPTTATVFKGFDPDTGRPVWAFTDAATNPTASLEPLGLYEMVPLVSSSENYPSVARGGIKANFPTNLRIVRSDNFGLALAWDRPDNALPAGVTGYRIDSTVNESCINVSPSNGANVLADGYLLLSSDPDSTDPSSWTCGSSNANNLISVRAIGTNGLGAAAFVSTSTLPTFDLDNLVPLAPANVAYINNGSNHIISWDEQTCAFGYDIQFRVANVMRDNAPGNFGIYTWDYFTPVDGRNSFILPSGDVRQGSTQGWTVEARCINDEFGISSASPASNMATATVPLTTTPTVATISASQTSLSGGTVTWSAGTGCPVGTIVRYHLTYTRINGAVVSQVLMDWTPDVLSRAIDTNLGTNATVVLNARCYNANGGNPQQSTNSARTANWTFDVTPNSSNLAISGTLSGTATWNAATNCIAGTTPQYRLSYATRNDVADTTNIFDWTAGVTSSAVSTNTGTQASVRLETRCNAGSENSSTQAITSALWRSGLLPPTGNLTIASVSGSNGVASAVSCSVGTPEYRLIKVTDSNNLTGEYAWSTSTTRTLSAYQGANVTGRMEARCALGTVYSDSITSPNRAWSLPVTSQPNVPGTTVRWGVSWYGIHWSWATGCPTGTSGYYTANMYRSGFYNQWYQQDGGASPYARVLNSTPVASAILYGNTYSSCRNPQTGAYGPWTTRLTRWNGNNASGYPSWN